MNPFPPRIVGHLGQEAGSSKKTDVGFFPWISGSAERPTDMELFGWLIDEFKSESDPDAVRALLDQWKLDAPEEFQERLAFLLRLMPPSHPVHTLKESYTTQTPA
jgi:hypothetical protein